MQKSRQTVVLILGVLLGIVLIQNSQDVLLHFLFWRMAIPKILLFPLLMFFGFLLGDSIRRRN